MSRTTAKSVTVAVAIIVGMMLLLAACSSKPGPSQNTTFDSAALIARGEELYQKTAGGVGCQMCHGADGKGKPFQAPGIRDATASDIRRALIRDSMSFIRVSEEDVQAIAEYLKSIQSQQ